MFKDRITSVTRGFERTIVAVLLVMLMIVVATAVWDMLLLLLASLKDMGTIQRDLQNVGELRDIFAAFLLVLIGIELMQTIKMYLHDDAIHVEIVLAVAIISVARHVIDLDFEALQPQALIGVGVLILGLTVGYYLLKRSIREDVDTLAAAQPPAGAASTEE